MKYIYLIITSFLFLSCNFPSTHQTLDESNKDPLIRLKEGNERFVNNKSIHPDQNQYLLANLNEGQHPFAVVIGCSDSRVPPELIFDQGFGDLFVIRTAGNVMGDYEIASIEYAVEHLNTKLVVVLGHESCGAIGAFIEHEHDKIDNHIQTIVDYIKDEPEEQCLDRKDPEFYHKAILANIEHGVNMLKSSEPVLNKFVEKNGVQIVGGIYNLKTGKVDYKY